MKILTNPVLKLGKFSLTYSRNGNILREDTAGIDYEVLCKRVTESNEGCGVIRLWNSHLQRDQ